MLGGEEEKDPDAQKKEEERQEALRQQEEERKAKYARMEAERENIRQGIRDKVMKKPNIAGKANKIINVVCKDADSRGRSLERKTVMLLVAAQPSRRHSQHTRRRVLF